MTPDLSDTEIDGICDGLVQNFAKVRHLRSLGLRVDRRPNGRPLVARAEWERVFSARSDSVSAPHASNGPRWLNAGGARA